VQPAGQVPGPRYAGRVDFDQLGADALLALPRGCATELVVVLGVT
jgi:hypothetical protein